MPLKMYEIDFFFQEKIIKKKMCAYPTLNFQTLFQKHTYFLTYLEACRVHSELPKLYSS